MNEFENRRHKLFDALPDNSVSLVFSGVSKICSEDEFYPFEVNRNFFYLTGIDQEHSVLMLVKCPGEKKIYLFMDEYNELKERWTGKRLTFEEAGYISGLSNIYTYDTLESMLDMSLSKENNFYGNTDTILLDLSDELKIDKNLSTQIYCEKLKEKYPHLKSENLYPYIVKLRLIKSDEEIKNLEEAINATNTGINDLLLNLRPGLKENELSDRFDYYGKTHGHRKLAFETICGAGIDGTVMHHPIKQQTRQINRGDLVLFDLGYKHNGYSADISRTYPVDGVFTELQRKIYEAVLNCNKAVIEYIKPGLTIMNLQEFAVEFLKKECVRLGLLKEEDDIKKYYIHNVSHYLGMDTHDVGDRNKPLEAGNIITVEPGLYFVEDGIGVRIEDDVLVTSTGSRCLSRGIKKEISDIEKLLKNRN